MGHLEFSGSCLFASEQIVDKMTADLV